MDKRTLVVPRRKRPLAPASARAAWFRQLWRRLAAHLLPDSAHAPDLHPPMCLHSFGALESRVMLSAPGAAAGDLAGDAATSQALTLFEMSPALFVENQGQWDDDAIRFVHFGSGANVLMTDAGPQFQVFRPVEGEAAEAGMPGEISGPGDDTAPVAMESLAFSAGFLGAALTSPVGYDASEATFNYFVGDIAQHRANVASFERIVYPGLYAGIDLQTWGQRSGLKYEFHVAPGSDYQQIQVQYEGIESLAIAEDGSLVVNLGEGWEPLVDAAPYVYQEIEGQRIEIESQYVLLEGGGYTFAVGAYDPAHELVIDPELAWSSYLGGSGIEQGRGIALDASGAAWVTGFTTSSTGFASGGFDTSHGGGVYDAFVTKINADGTLAWSSYLGGPAYDEGYGVAVDASGAAWVTGETFSSTGFASGGFDTSLDGSSDAFVAKVNADGTLAWSSYLGGSSGEFGRGIAVDASGAAWVTGFTSSSTGFASGGFDTSHGGGFYDAFVTKVNADGTLAWSSYLGGTGNDYGYAIAVDASGAAWVTGYTESSTGFASGGFDTSHGGGRDAFVTKVNADGTLAWSSYLGGTGNDAGNGIAVDDSGAAWVTGYTASHGFAIGGFDTSLGGSLDAFVAKINADGTLAWSSYLGGTGSDSGYAIAVDASGAAWVTGDTTSSTGFASGGFDTSHGGGLDAFVAKINADGTLAWSSYLGGSGRDEGYGIAVDASGAAWVTGRTFSSTGIATAGGFDTSYGGGDFDAFVAKITEAVSLAGTTWHDVNGDGVRDGGEPVLGGQTVFLDTDNDGQLDWTDGNANDAWDEGEGERWTLSDAGDGTYTFTGLAPGDYNVRQIPLLGYTAGPMLPKLLAPDAAAGDWFGSSVSISDGIAIIGASGDDDGGAFSGSAYLYNLETGAYTKLTAPDGASGDNFGDSVSISGGIAIIGAHGHDEGGTNAGAAYLYDLETGVYTKLKAPDAAEGDWFGAAVSISDGIAIIGARYHPDGGNSTGAAYLYNVATGVYTKLTMPNAADGDLFGYSVSITDGIAIIGAPGDDDGGAFSGSAYLYNLETEVYTKLAAPDAAELDHFGAAVSISDGIAIIGAPEDDDGGTSSGSAYLYNIEMEVYTKLAAPDAAELDRFGAAVSISDGIAIVGAPDDDDGGNSSGSAYLYNIESGAYTKLTAPDGDRDERFGYSVSFGDGITIVGAYHDDDGGLSSGSAYLFDAQRGELITYGRGIDMTTGADAAVADIPNYNPAPTLTETSFTVPENLAEGDAIGSLAAFDLYGDTLAWAIIGGNDDGLFAVDPATGVVRVADGMTLDFETATSHVLTLQATDLASNTATADLTVSVTDVDDSIITGVTWHDLNGDGVRDDGEPALGGQIVFLDADNDGQLDWTDGDDNDAWDEGEGERWTISDAVDGTYTFIGLAAGDYNVRQVPLPAYTAGPMSPKLIAPDAAAGDGLGSSVSLSEGIAIIGARYHDDGGSDSGAAYLYNVATGTYTKLTMPGAAAGDWFGHSVSISDGIAIIGAPNDDDGGSNSGSAYLYSLGTGAYTKLAAPDAAAGDWFGASVSISDGIAIIGAPNADDGGSNSGSAYLYNLETGVYTKLTAPDAAATDGFGASVSVSDGIAIIGAPYADDGGGDSGAAYLYDLDTGVYTKLTAPDAAGGDVFGASVSISDGIAIIGAPNADDGGSDSGSAYLYDLATGVYTRLTALDAADSDYFGFSVSLNNGVAVIGAPLNDGGGSDSGSAYLYDLATGVYTKLTAPDAADSDYWGYSVSISEGIAIIGALFGDDAGSDSGSVHLLDVHGGDFITYGRGIDVTTGADAAVADIPNYNPAPTLSDTSLAVPEDLAEGDAIGSVAAFDLYGDTLAWAITGGNDDGLFTVDPATGVVRLADGMTLDFETTTSHVLTLEATDLASNTATADLTLNITDINEAPSFTSATAFSAAENQSAAAQVAATDPEDDALTFSLAGGADATLFDLDSATGALTFLVAPNFEAPGDEDGDNVYEVQVQVSDGALTDSQTVLVTVTNVNEPPMLTSATSFEAAENQTDAATITASDVDAGAMLALSIIGGADASLFELDGATGVLTFKDEPDFETPGDADSDGVYQVQVQVSDGALTDSQTVLIAVANVNEPPMLTSAASFEAAENQTAAATITASDVDAGAMLAFSILGGADASLFELDGATGALTFKAAPNFEVPGDADGDNVYEVQVQVSDGSLTDSQTVLVAVVNVNEPPMLTSAASFDAAENQTAAATITASDVDAGAMLAFSILGGADASLFDLDPATGALTFKAAPDFEAPGDVDGDNVYEVQVQVSDGSLTDSQTVLVAVANVNEPPMLTSAASFDAAENQTAAATITASDVDAGATLSYTITGGADASLFQLDGATGVLTFKDEPDYETPGDADGDNVYEVQVQVSDGALTDSQTVLIAATNVNEPPMLTSAASFDAAENQSAAATITASDVDAGAMLAFSILGGADASLFDLDPATGALTFKAAPDFEAPGDADGDNVYEVQVQVSDGALTDSQTLMVAVTNINEPPVLTSAASFEAAENRTVAATITASDVDAGATLSYTILGGADASLFDLDPATGALTFKAAPDFEAPGDAGGDNVYEVQVQVSDGELTDTQTVLVAVTNINEPPAFTSAIGISVPEHQLAVATITASDPDAGAVLAYTLSGGADSHLFSVDEVTGTLVFQGEPDFEAPADADGDNVYRIEIEVSDGEHVVVQEVAVNVTDLHEIAFRAGSPATYSDAAGRQIILGLAGAGEGIVRFGPGESVHVVLTGTNAGTKFAAIATEPGYRTLLDSLIVAGDIGVISARAVDLGGQLTVDGHARAIALGQLDGSLVTLGGTATQATALELYSLTDTAVTSAAGIDRMVVRTAWTDTDAAADRLAAPWVWQMAVAGQMHASLELSGVSAPRGYALGALAAGAIRGGRFDLQAGSVGRILAGVGGIDDLTIHATAGAITRLVSHGHVTDLDLHTGHMQALGVVGDLADSDLRLTTPGGTGLAKLVTTGRLIGSMIESAGHVLTFQAGGMTDSRLFVGVTDQGKASADHLPEADMASFSASRPVLVSAVIRGSDNSGLLRSQIAAARLMKLAIVGELAGDPVTSVAGVTADRIDTYLDYNPVTAAIRQGARLTTPSDATTQLGTLPEGVALRLIE